MRLVTVLVVLVEGPVAAADEPCHASAAEGFFPTPDVPLVLGLGQVARLAGAVGWHDAHADDRVGAGLLLQEPPGDLGDQLPGRVAAFWASR